MHILEVLEGPINHVLYFLKAWGSRISNMTFPCDMVDMDMVDMDMMDMDTSLEKLINHK